MIIPPTPHGVAHAFFSNLKVMLGVFALCVGACVAYLLVATPIYAARASLTVDFGENARVAIDEDAGGMILPETRRATVNNYQRVLASRDLLGAVVAEIGVQRLFPDLETPEGAETPPISLFAGPEETDAAAEPVLDDRLLAMAVRAFRDSLEIDVSYEDTVIALSYFHKDPNLAEEALQTLIDAFIAKRAELFENPHLRFLEGQLAATEAGLTEARDRLFAFRRQSGVFLPERQLTRLVDQRETIQSEIDTLGYELDGLASSIGADSPRLIASRASAETRIAFLEEQKGRADERIAAHESAHLQLAQLQQQLTAKEDTYQAVLERLEAARFADRVNADSISPVSVLDQPKTDDKPARPRKTLLLFAAGLLGGIAALCIGIGREVMQSRFATPEQSALLLGLPVLAVAPAGAPNLLTVLFDTAEGARRARRKKRDATIEDAAPAVAAAPDAEAAMAEIAPAGETIPKAADSADADALPQPGAPDAELRPTGPIPAPGATQTAGLNGQHDTPKTDEEARR